MNTTATEKPEAATETDRKAARKRRIAQICAFPIAALTGVAVAFGAVDH